MQTLPLLHLPPFPFLLFLFLFSPFTFISLLSVQSPLFLFVPPSKSVCLVSVLRYFMAPFGERGGQSIPSLFQICSQVSTFSSRNQGAAGNLAKRWEKTGIIMETQENDKYLVKVDGSWTVTHRNRRFLRSFKPALRTSLLLRTQPDVCLSRLGLVPY